VHVLDESRIPMEIRRRRRWYVIGGSGDEPHEDFGL
jgi:hypothetical protein